MIFEKAIEKIYGQQNGIEDTAAYCVGEQLKDIIRTTPESEELVFKDLRSKIMVKTREIETNIPDARESLIKIKQHYENKIKPGMPFVTEMRIRNVIAHIKLAIEALEILEPIELYEGKCQSCGRVFSEKEIKEGDFRYCPQCGQALLDWCEADSITTVNEAEDADK